MRWRGFAAKAHDSARTAASWASSVRWAAQGWREGRLTRPYLRGALRQAGRSIEDERRGLQGKAGSPGVDLGVITSLLEREAAAVTALDAAIEREDRAAAAAAEEELSRARRDLLAVAAALGPSRSCSAGCAIGCSRASRDPRASHE